MTDQWTCPHCTPPARFPVKTIRDQHVREAHPDQEQTR